MTDSLEEMLESFKDNPAREDHMKILAAAFFENLRRDDCEYGGIGVNSKRPFGNSSVEFDIAEIIGFDSDRLMDEDGNYDEDLRWYLNDLYSDLIFYLPYMWKKLNQ